jgi:signal transduction histidine kinase
MALLFSVMLGLSTAILAYFLYVIAPENLHPESLNTLKIFSVIIVFLMLGVVLVSFGISHFVVSRINRIAGTAQNIIDTGDLSERITVDTKWDDLSNLAQTLNGFLVQIEGLMSSIREVSNNIAHDLRTPLTGLRADIESLKGKQVTDEDLDGLLAEADRILGIFQSLLRITNIEKGKRHQIFREVNLVTVLEDVLDLYDPVAEEKRIILIKEIEGNLAVKGDADLLFQLFTNLLDNAIKFSRHESEVFIAAKMDSGEVKVVIKDSGSGIPDDEKEHVFRHFFRGDESRGSEGYGLWLSLVERCVREGIRHFFPSFLSVR